MPLRTVSLDDLTIQDERAFAHVALYGALKQVLRRSAHKFLVPASGAQLSWDRAVFLNLTFWNANEGADVLCDEHEGIPADVVAHVAWHHLIAKQIEQRRSAPATGPAAHCIEAMLFAESIASSFDLYLVGRLLRNRPDSDFITTQVSIMGEAAEQAGLGEQAFAALLDDVADQPERAFEDLRRLLFDVSRALYACRDAVQAQLVLEGFTEHRFHCLLHHYQLSNWVLYARAYAVPAAEQEQIVRELDANLRAAPVSLDWLVAEVLPAYAQ
jgi:hypothetical protein